MMKVRVSMVILHEKRILKISGEKKGFLIHFMYHSCPHPHDVPSVSPPQQDPASPPQLHSPLSISFPRKAALIIAQAHPTPLCTSIACTGQLRAQAPHSIQASGRVRFTCSFPSVKTPLGQTCVQRLQLMHRSGSNVRLVSVYESKSG